MRRLLTPLIALVLLLTVAAPTVLAAEPVTIDSGRVVISLDGPVTVPADQSLDALVVANGIATIAGDVDHVLLVDGTATATGATIGSLLVIDGTATLDSGTVVTGDVSTLNGTIAAAPGATIVRPVRDLKGDLAALSLALIPLLILFMLGAALLVVLFALFLAAVAGRQVRSVESLISREPGLVLIAGIAGTLLLPAVSFLLMATVIGAPLGLILLFVVTPTLAFLGWVIAAVWLGDWLLGRLRGRREAERPYFAAVVGVIVLAFAGMIPFVSMIATLFGFGAVLLALWRVLRGGSATADAVGPTPPTQGGPGAWREPSSLPGVPGGYGAPVAYAAPAGYAAPAAFGAGMAGVAYAPTGQYPAAQPAWAPAAPPAPAPAAWPAPAPATQPAWPAPEPSWPAAVQPAWPATESPTPAAAAAPTAVEAPAVPADPAPAPAPTDGAIPDPAATPAPELAADAGDDLDRPASSADAAPPAA